MYDLIGSIVLYNNSSKQILEAVTSFLNTQLNVGLYLIDNSPDQRLLDSCKDHRVTYIFNGRNLGFGAGHNLAMNVSQNKAKYHVVLNPDIYFEPGVLETLFSFACSRPEIGLLMPKVLSADGSIQRLCKRLPTPSDLFIRRFLPQVFKTLVKERLA